jgi:hypothetical protein
LTGIKKHITLALLGIFVFPIVFQPFHIIWHHAEDSHCHHECCPSEEKKPVGLIFDVFSANNEYCPICEYHFPVNDLPENFFFASATKTVTSSVYELKIKPAYQQITSTKTPRAPPV